MVQPDQPSLPRVVGLFGLAYLLSYALRNVQAAISPFLIEDLGLSPADLGLLTSAYLLSFALMQLPLGILLDRYGARRVESLLLLVAALGCGLMASSDSLWLLWLGRALVGIGVSACLMASYQTYRQIYRPEIQTRLASTMLIIGSAGALLATDPVVRLLTLISWRELFAGLGGLFLITALLLAWGLPPLRHSERSTERLWQGLRAGIADCMGHPEFRRLGPFALLGYGGYLGVQGLWIGPWLSRVEGQTTEQIGLSLAVLMAMAVLGHFAVAGLAGRLARSTGSTERLMRIGLSLMTLTLWAALLGLSPNPLLAWALVFVFGGTTTLMYSRFSLCFSRQQAGRATTSLNFLIFLGAFGVQWGIGLLTSLLEAADWTPVEALQGAMVIWALMTTTSLAWMMRRPVRPLAASPSASLEPASDPRG